jgi:hypothetical protein
MEERKRFLDSSVQFQVKRKRRRTSNIEHPTLKIEVEEEEDRGQRTEVGMQRELWRPATMAKPNWHGRNEVKANRRSEEEEEEEEEEEGVSG